MTSSQVTRGAEGLRPDGGNGRAARYRQAGVVYIGVGILVVLITLFTPGLVSPGRYSEVAQLIFALPFFFLAGFLIARGDRAVAGLTRRFRFAPERSERIGRWVQETLTMLLTLSALGRTFVFASNAVGWQPEIHARPFAFHLHSIDPLPLMLINASLMAIIVAMLARASWVPLVKREV